MNESSKIETLDDDVISYAEVNSGRIKTLSPHGWKPRKAYHWIGDANVNSGSRWKNLRVLRLKHTTREAYLPPLPYNLILVYQGAPSRQHTRLDGKNLQFLQRSGSVTVTPAFQTMMSWYDDTEQDDVYLHLTPEYLKKTALESDLNPDKIELVDAFCVHNPQIEHIAALALGELHHGGAGGQLYADSLATLLAMNLLRNYTAHSRTAQAREQGLTPLQLRRAVEFINENLGEDLDLKTIAATVGIGEFHFLRQFKKSTNQSPHQYIIERRLERAQNLLLNTALSNTEIAYNLGFSTPSHFAAAFRKKVGVTPSRFRK
jgi:AraC family transcriptional regulator